MSKSVLIAIAAYFAFISLLAIILTVSDKRRSINRRWRIPERTLLLVGLLGGSLAEYCAMKVIHHKTLHKRFMVGLPLMMALQIAVAIYLLIRFNILQFH